MSQPNAVRDTYTKTSAADVRTGGWPACVQVAQSGHLKYADTMWELKDAIPLWPVSVLV